MQRRRGHLLSSDYYRAGSRLSTSITSVAEKIDPDDLVDANGVAEILDLSRRSSVAVYRKRYADFPTPVVDMGAGRCLLWLRADVEAWMDGRRNAT